MKLKLISFLFLIVICSCGQHDIEFDSEKWKNWEETEGTASMRWDMVNSLFKKHKLVGLNESEVINLLGEPSSVHRLKFYYYLGYSRRGINTGSLEVTFDNNGIVNYTKVSDG